MEDCLEEVISEELKKEVTGCLKVNFLPAIKRCLKNPPYLRSAGKKKVLSILETFKNFSSSVCRQPDFGIQV